MTPSLGHQRRMTVWCLQRQNWISVRRSSSQVGVAIFMPARLSTVTTLAGDMSLHLVPAIQIGVNVLNGALLDAQV
jgi:hypothetical protein